LLEVQGGGDFKTILFMVEVDGSVDISFVLGWPLGRSKLSTEFNPLAFLVMYFARQDQLSPP
jgi:hypothetical protein